jgi:hypothetical protein
MWLKSFDRFKCRRLSRKECARNMYRQRLREWPIEDCPRSIRQLGQAAGVRALVDLVTRIDMSSDWFVEILDPLTRNWISLQFEIMPWSQTEVVFAKSSGGSSSQK